MLSFARASAYRRGNSRVNCCTLYAKRAAACAISRSRVSSYGAVAASVMRNIESLISLSDQPFPANVVDLRRLNPRFPRISFRKSAGTKKRFDPIPIQFDFEFVQRETRANEYTWTVRACVRAKAGLPRVSAGMETEFHSASLNIGMETRRHASVHHPRVFCFTMRAAQVAVAGVGRVGGRSGVEWRYLRNKEMVHRTSNNNVRFPSSPPAIVIRVVSCIRIVRSINHRAKRSGDFLTPFPSRREGRDTRRRRRITFLDRNDDCTRLRKRSNSFVVVRNCEIEHPSFPSYPVSC